VSLFKAVRLPISDRELATDCGPARITLCPAHDSVCAGYSAENALHELGKSFACR
jgi:hypothetical protein